MKNFNYVLSVPIILLVIILLFFSALYPQLCQASLAHIVKFISGWFGWFVQLASLGLVFFLLWLAFSKYGSIRLSEDPTEHSNFSYAGMIFTAGVGASLIYWAIGEPISYLQSPPLFAEPNSYSAASWAVTYSMFHWGITGWAIYCFPAIPFSFALYIEKRNVLRFSKFCRPLLGKNNILNNVIDIIAIFGTLGAFASSLALTVELLSEGVSTLLGIENQLRLQGAIILLFIVSLASVILVGFNRGIKKISDMTVICAILLSLYVLLVTDAQFILHNFTDSLGVMLNNFFRMSLWLDPVQKSGFPQSWTQYYWFWYYAYAAMTGLFIARISRGRTIKEVILYSLSMGSLGCATIISIFGGYAIWAQLFSNYPIHEWVVQKGLSSVVISLMQTLPMPKFVLSLFLVIEFFLMLTTMASASVAIAMMTTRRLPLNGDPNQSFKFLWAVVMGVISLCVFLSGGGIDTIKTLSVIVGFPMMLIFILLMIFLMKKLSYYHKI